ncbi:uncharacterized protein LOC132271309 isoform X2 [Cornus florida]|nr:uncharacterized protein LOC132271309 isoform X2 [Cornus florida]
MVNTGRGQNLNRRQRRAARRQQEHLQRQQMEEEQQRLEFQDEGQLQEEQEEVQAPAQGRDPEYPPHINDLIARAIEAGVAAVLRNQPQVQPAPLPAPVVQTDTWEKARSSFTKGSPPEFTGSTDARAAHQWKQDIERHLRLVQCTEVQKQMLATFKLVGDALQWWESVTTIEERMALTYDEFSARFEEKYFPYAVRAAMKTEFLNLQQGNMTVAEYEQQFTRLSLFAPEEVDTEEKKRNSFVNGLMWSIKRAITGSPAYTTYAQVVDAALQLYQLNEDFRQTRAEKRGGKDFANQPAEKVNDNGNRQNDKGRFQGQQPWKRHKGNSEVQREGVPTPQTGAPQTGQGQLQGNHQEGQSSIFRGHCYKCGDYGHSAKRCPGLAQNQHGQQGQWQPLPTPQIPRVQAQTFPALPAPPPPQGQPIQQLHQGMVYNATPCNAWVPQKN